MNMQWKTTSDKSDEPICIATILGLDTLTLLNTPAAEREKELVRMLKVFPAEVIFDPQDKFAEDGIRWAPTTFINPARRRGVDVGKPSDYNLGGILPQGLLVKFPGIILCVEKSPVNKFFFIAELRSGELYRADLNISLGEPGTNYHSPCKVLG